MALWGNNTQPSSDGPDPETAAESDTALILAVVTVLHVVALVFVGLRIYARAWIIRSFERDDAVVACAAVGYPSGGTPRVTSLGTMLTM